MKAAYEFDVALSFAGEQRAEVERVAELLTASNVRVFYDKYDKVSLWGKDLYQHLSDIYKNKAEYCIVFASAEYAQKAWTSHELKSAQARAFEEKGNEYILPVRFDSTEIPGVLPTTGYLDFKKETAAGIAEAFIHKLGREAAARVQTPSPDYTCELSPRALIHPGGLNWRLFPPVESASWSNEIELEIVSESKSIDAALAQLRSNPDTTVVAHGFDVALAKLRSAKRKTSGKVPSWELIFSPDRTEFSNDFEMGTSSLTADEFAERRARRLLLNEFPAPDFVDSSRSIVEMANAATYESLVVGLNSVAEVKRSDFPLLFKEYRSSAKDFLEIAWISAIANLKMSAAVEHINRLKLSLEGETLSVDFSGRRHRKYQNVDPYRIDISGKLHLSESTKNR